MEPGEDVHIRKEPYVTVRGRKTSAVKSAGDKNRILLLTADGSCRFNVVDANGFYSGISDYMQFRADHNDLTSARNVCEQCRRQANRPCP